MVVIASNDINRVPVANIISTYACPVSQMYHKPMQSYTLSDLCNAVNVTAEPFSD